MPTIKSICVFCSSIVLDHSGVALAQDLANEFIEHDITFIYGGGNLGMMGHLAKSMHERGGKVIGFMPRIFRVLTPDNVIVEVQEPVYGQVIHAPDFHIQLKLFSENSDAFIAFPGGLGTLQEIIHFLVENSLNIIHKPLAILNVDGFFDHFLLWLNQAEAKGFTSAPIEKILIVSNNIPDLMKQVLNWHYTETK